jgi:YaiO family outer membrane protein
MAVLWVVPRRPITVATLVIALAARAACQPEPEARSTAPLTTLGGAYTYSAFGGPIDSWHLGTVSLGSRRAQGTFIGRVNRAKRFDVSGVQFEVDAYPVLATGKYVYLSAGYSRVNIFPEQRYGAEYFTILRGAYEGSIGVRNLRFPTEQVTLFTGSLGRYSENSWISLRPYLARRDGSGLTAGVSLAGRRYYADGDTYIGARIGGGSAPIETLDPSQLARKSAIMLGLQASRPASPRVITTWLLNYERDKNPVRTVRRWEFGAGLKIRL